MKLRKLRKNTRPTKKKVVLFPHKARMKALEEAVQQYNELLETYRSVISMVSVDVKIDESNPSLIHFTGVSEAPVERVVVECKVSKLLE